MGLRGPKPLPTAAKIAAGTYRADRAAANEPATTGRPTCPNWLTPDESKLFRNLVRQFIKMKMVGSIDSNSLARYCRLWFRWRESEQKIQEEGSVLTTDKGYHYANPHCGLSRSLSDQLQRIEQSFGMNPSARTRISVAESAPSDESAAKWAGLLDGGG